MALGGARGSSMAEQFLNEWASLQQNLRDTHAEFLRHQDELVRGFVMKVSAVIAENDTAAAQTQPEESASVDAGELAESEELELIPHVQLHDATSCIMNDAVRCAAKPLVHSCGLLPAHRFAQASQQMFWATSSYLEQLFPTTICVLWYRGASVSGGQGAQRVQSKALACYDIVASQWKRIELPVDWDARRPRLEVLRGKAYSFEGDDNPYVCDDDERILRIEPRLGQCMFLPPLLRPRKLPQLVAGASCIYAIGGDEKGTAIRRVGAAVESFDADTFRWDALPSIDADALFRVHPGLSLHFGRRSRDATRPVCIDGYTYTLSFRWGKATLCKISPLTGELFVLPPYPTRITPEDLENTDMEHDVQHVQLQSLGSVIATRGLIYVVGGLLTGHYGVEGEECHEIAGKRSVWYFDTQDAAWHLGPVLSLPRVSPKLASLNGNIFVFGGRGMLGERAGLEVERILVPGMQSQVVASTPFKVASAVSFRNELFIIGGSGQFAKLSASMTSWICLPAFDHSLGSDRLKASSVAL